MFDKAKTANSLNCRSSHFCGFRHTKLLQKHCRVKNQAKPLPKAMNQNSGVWPKTLATQGLIWIKFGLHSANLLILTVTIMSSSILSCMVSVHKAHLKLGLDSCLTESTNVDFYGNHTLSMEFPFAELRWTFIWLPETPKKWSKNLRNCFKI